MEVSFIHARESYCKTDEQMHIQCICNDFFPPQVTYECLKLKTTSKGSYRQFSPSSYLVRGRCQFYTGFSTQKFTLYMYKSKIDYR